MIWWLIAVVALLLTTVVLLGLRLRRTNQALLVAQQTAAAAVDSQHRTAELAVAAERIRIVREMHDVLAHSLAIMIAQADGGSYVVDDTPSARRALLTIAETGRAALRDTRRILGVLRHGEDDGPGLTPVPDDASTKDLVERARKSGMPVALVQLGQPRPLPAGSRMALYRICQEGLTNVFKHAGATARTVVTQDWRDDQVCLTITNEGGERSRSDQDPLAGYGLGLIGMRERAELVGGTLRATATEDGFLVQAVLPFRGAPGLEEDSDD